MTRTVAFPLVLLAAATLNGSRPEAAMPTPPRVTRKDLLDTPLSPERTVGSVRIQEITLGAGQPVPLHSHPCPVVGVVRSGAITFQIEGQSPRHLRAGDAFYEPAGARIARFDSEGDEPATFTAFYLLGPGEHDLIHMLER